ncbi:MAG: hypothetical protein H7841_08885 [Magnetospirillum sp. WYHS-4]
MSDIVKTPYTGGITVLSQVSQKGISQSRLLSQMSSGQQKVAEEKIGAISGLYEQKIARLGREEAKWKGLVTDVGKATSDISNIVGRLKSMSGKIESMIRSVNKADQRDQEGQYVNPAGYAASFDSILKGLHQDAIKGDKQPNMLGADGVSYSYRTSISNDGNKVMGAYLGSEYKITDSEGKIWAADLSAGLVQRYDDYPTDKAAESGNIVNGIRLDSQSGDSVTFTTAPDTASPQQFSGTIERKGLRLVNSWFYEGFSTEGGRSRALADLNDAKEAVKLEIARYELSLKTAKFYEARARNEAKGYRNQGNALQIESAQEIAKAQKALAREYNAAQGLVAQALAQKTGYAKMFQSTGGTALGNKLVNILT